MLEIAASVCEDQINKCWILVNFVTCLPNSQDCSDYKNLP